MKIGIYIGKAFHYDRGITGYVRNILREFADIGVHHQFFLLYYPESVPDRTLGIKDANLVPIFYSDTHGPLVTMMCEQIGNPFQQKKLKLDAIWHYHNRCQLWNPVRYVCTMHDVLPLSHPELARGYLTSSLKRALFLSRVKTAKYADSVVTVSEFSRDQIVKHLSVDPKKIVVAYPGVDRDIFRPIRDLNELSRVTNMYNLPNTYLLTVGSYADHKNLLTLVDAFAQSDLLGEGVGLVMVGPNNATGYRVGYQKVVQRVNQLGIANSVRLLTSIPINDLVIIYSNAMMFAIPSRYEGFGSTPLEAMACAVPVIASNSSAIPEVCGKAALYANPNDISEFVLHFNKLLSDSDMRKQMVELGLSQVAKYSWTDCANMILKTITNTTDTQKIL